MEQLAVDVMGSLLVRVWEQVPPYCHGLFLQMVGSIYALPNQEATTVPDEVFVKELVCHFGVEYLCTFTQTKATIQICCLW